MSTMLRDLTADWPTVEQVDHLRDELVRVRSTVERLAAVVRWVNRDEIMVGRPNPTVEEIGVLASVVSLLRMELGYLQYEFEELQKSQDNAVDRFTFERWRTVFQSERSTEETPS